MDDTAEIRALAGSVPALLGYAGPIERLGGLTNRVYRLGGYCLRIPGPGTEAYINRAQEAVMARRAAEAGISPEVVYADPASGGMVTRYVAGAVTLTPEGFATRPGAVERTAHALRTLHRSGAGFPVRFELFAMIDAYLKLLSAKTVPLPTGYANVLAEADRVRAAFAARPVPLAPCHCDPLCENFLDTGEKVWIVDWEYSGMNDPMWDLGDLSVEAAFTPAQDVELLRAYFGAAPARADVGRMMIYKAMCDLLWTLWGLIQWADNNPADDFHAYALRRFTRCRALMAQPAFATHLAAI